MRVLVTAVAQPSGISGVQRHALNLVRCLLQRSEITGVHLALAPWQLHLPRLAGLERHDRLLIHIAQTGRGSLARNLWHMRDLAKLACEADANLVHLSYPVPFIRSLMPCSVVMTLHDLYPFQIPRNFGFPQVLINRLISRFALQQADAISCVSAATLRALQSSTLSSAPLVTIIPNCVEPGVPTSPCGPLAGWNGEPFLLTVAQHRRNKNLDPLLRSFADLLASRLLPGSTRLVIVGMHGPETPKLHSIVRALGIHSRVDFLEDLSDSNLQWCYRQCSVLVAPSSIEGFGLPVVEARLAGCRIVCSDIPAFREFAGPQAHFVDLCGDAQLHLNTAITHALATTRPAPERLPEFGMETVANCYVELYEETLRRQTPSARLSTASGPLEKRHML